MYVGRRMTRNVVTASAGDPVARAAVLLKEHRIHHLPVVSGNELEGIVTDTDIRNAAVAEPAGGRTVGEIMTRDPVTVGAWDTVEDALLLLHRRRFGALPVVEGRKLIGIISKTDILAALIDTLDIEGVGVRLEVLLPSDTASLLRLVRAVGETGAEVRSLVVSPFRGQFVAFLRLATIDIAGVRARLKGAGFAIPDLSDFLD